ncbi:hypothetical protein ACJMK2_035686 [Sinanodonta woodiana]|uniref:Uncharacterized protein n=1 Tax=Sinanodonta woodiana TaxID=1069815 RepID=A0ABD3WZN9_SINWO
MNLSCAFSIVVLFVTGLNIPLVVSQTSTNVTSTNTTAASTSAKSTAANTTAASISNTTTVPNATAAASTSTPTSTSQISNAVCIEHTCNVSGCLTNASNTRNCTGPFCTMVQRFTVNQASYNITAGCASSCSAKDGVDGDFTVRTRCCQTDKCNNNDAQIVALTKNGGSASYQAPVWILSIMMFISAFEILM